ncbi:UTP--glucose-1-phosphate uridylyltransferase [Pseudomonas sp. ISL-88]|uniref:UTP--glucose-1-phosphate uridylyltransferase n=1 Tax=Bacteria TaxID=2 RepID=UPI001BE9C1F3|nr:UTP--glucose-1-phosphate uridylyltransferase [Pseudomonas sp. ISL-88]MBT2711428.1 UTP--glucose-1-phosphate uridylyltransferase [Pseudomonas sp. ISL-88]
MNKKVRKTVIPAAGLGTRFLPATKEQPKEMLPIVDKPVSNISQKRPFNQVEDILIITGRNKRSIEDHFDRSAELEFSLKEKGKTEILEEMRQIANLANIHYIRQKEPLGLGHAVLCAEHFIGDEPFAVLLGDDTPALLQLLDVYDEYGTAVVGGQPVEPADVSKYGIIQMTHHKQHVYQVEDLVEKPSSEKAPSHIAVMGRYVLNPSIFQVLKTIGRGAGNEIQLTAASMHGSLKGAVLI